MQSNSNIQRGAKQTAASIYCPTSITQVVGLAVILYSQVNYMITPMVDVRMHHEYQHGQEVGHTKLDSLRKGQSEIDLPPKASFLGHSNSPAAASARSRQGNVPVGQNGMRAPHNTPNIQVLENICCVALITNYSQETQCCTAHRSQIPWQDVSTNGYVFSSAHLVLGDAALTWTDRAACAT